MAADGLSFFGAASDCNYTLPRDVVESMHLFVVHGKLFVRLCVPANPSLSPPIPILALTA